MNDDDFKASNHELKKKENELRKANKELIKQKVVSRRLSRDLKKVDKFIWSLNNFRPIFRRIDLKRNYRAKDNYISAA